MNVFVAHTFSENLSADYYDLILQVYKLIKENNHKILVGGLFTKLKDNLLEYEDIITCYSLRKYQEEERKLLPNGKYILTDNIYSRTKNLMENSDIVVILPGGSGSLAEIFSILEAYKYLESKNKIYILNYHNHYDDLINYLKKLEDNKFNKRTDLAYLKIINLKELKSILESR